MSLFASTKRPSSLRYNVVTLLKWYYFRKPTLIVRSYVKYASAFLEIFSVWFLIKTLFKPWKNIVEAYPKSFLQVDRVMQAFFLNITTRMVGALVRMCMIIIGLFVQITIITWFAIYLGLWLSFPFLLPILPFA